MRLSTQEKSHAPLAARGQGGDEPQRVVGADGVGYAVPVEGVQPALRALQHVARGQVHLAARPRP